MSSRYYKTLLLSSMMAASIFPTTRSQSAARAQQQPGYEEHRDLLEDNEEEDLVLPATSATTTSLPCSLCPGAAPEDASVSIPEASIYLPDFGQFSCIQLEALAPILLHSDDAECKLIRSIGSICGCPVPSTTSTTIHPENACRLCDSANDEDSQQDEDEDVESVASTANTVLSVVPADFLGETVRYQNVTVTCELLEVSLGSTFESKSQECKDVQQELSNYCGCSSSTTTASNETEGSSMLPRPQDRPQENNDEMTTQRCTMCWDGSESPLPDKDVSFVAEILSLSFPKNLNLTCSSASLLIGSLEPETGECIVLTTIVGGICGCPAVSNACELCPNDVSIPFPDKLFAPLLKVFGFTLSCQDVAGITSQHRATGPLDAAYLDFLGMDRDLNPCFASQATSYVCGCNGGQRQYRGANTEAKRAALAWTPRVSGFLSFVGSSLILWDVRRVHKLGYARMYHQLVTMLSIFDILSSSMWILSTAPIQKTLNAEFKGGYESKVYGAIGNKQTCTAQGFFFQLGYIGSILYNFCLAVYYLLVIVYGKQDNAMKKLRWGFHGFPLISAFSLAITGIPHYQFLALFCSIEPPPLNPSWRNVLVFLVVPVCSVILGSTVIMSVIYCSVRRKVRAARRWAPSPSNRSLYLVREDTPVATTGGTSTRRPGQEPSQSSSRPGRRIIGSRMSRQQSSRSKTETAVFWQCAFYLLAFYVTWPLYIAALMLVDESATLNYYPLSIVIVFLTPLQGFFNALTYARPRLLAWWNE